MRLLPNQLELSEKRIGAVLERFIEIIGERDLLKRIEKWKKKRESCPGPISKQWVDKENRLFSIMSRYLEAKRRGRSIWKLRNPEIFGLAKRALVLNHIYNWVSPVGKKKIKGRLLSENISDSLWFEVKVVTHFFKNGFNVDFCDLEETSSQTFEFLISKSGMTAEVECKTKSYDAGRRIKRINFYKMVDFVLKQMRKHKDNMAILVQCSDKLPSKDETLRQLAQSVALFGGEIDSEWTFINSLYECNVYARTFRLFEEIKPEWRFKRHIAISKGLVIFAESSKPRNVLQAIYGDLKKGCDQFTKQRQAILTCHIEGIEDYQWKYLAENSGLKAITHHLLESKPYLDTILFSSGDLLFYDPNNPTATTKGLRFSKKGGIGDKEHFFKLESY